MTTIPEWPSVPGPRVLTLVGNDITIDARPRKTASSLARAGFSVISLGIDQTGDQPKHEDIDGALIWRVTPSMDSRLSTRRLRLSRAELRDALWFRLEMRRQRLEVRRRSFTAVRHWRSQSDPPWVQSLGSLAAALTRMLGISQDDRDHVRSRGDRYLRRVDRGIRFGPTRVRLVLEQRVTQALTLVYKVLARPPTRKRHKGDWRTDLPELHRYEAAMGSLVDTLEPDLIHVHDVFHIGVAARAKARAEHDGRDVTVVYDAHEFVSGLPVHPVRRAALTQLEDEYIHRVDAIVVVSDRMADAIQARHGITPEVVMNAPDMDTLVEVKTLRSVCDIPDGVPIVSYVGGIAPHRGAELMLEALRNLDGVHLVLVVDELSAYVRGLLEDAAEMGLADRVRTAPFVRPEAVVSYMRSVDVSLIPLSRQVPNYEMALPNKLFQSIHAGVPVVVSDNPAMAEFVGKNQIGEVFEGGTARSMAAAIKKVLDNSERYRASLEDEDLLEQLSWASQMRNLLTVYRRLGIRSQ